MHLATAPLLQIPVAAWPDLFSCLHLDLGDWQLHPLGIVLTRLAQFIWISETNGLDAVVWHVNTPSGTSDRVETWSGASVEASRAGAAPVMLGRLFKSSDVS